MAKIGKWKQTFIWKAFEKKKNACKKKLKDKTPKRRINEIDLIFQKEQKYSR